MSTEVTTSVNKKVPVNGILQTVSFNWHPVGERYDEKSYMKKTKWGTFMQKEYMKACVFIIDGKEHQLQTLFVELAAGGYSRYFIVDGIKFNDSHKKVIESLLKRNHNENS
jgi:hypothetical protein